MPAETAASGVIPQADKKHSAPNQVLSNGRRAASRTVIRILGFEQSNVPPIYINRTPMDSKGLVGPDCGVDLENHDWLDTARFYYRAPAHSAPFPLIQGSANDCQGWGVASRRANICFISS
jgi:hypothetical protein